MNRRERESESFSGGGLDSPESGFRFTGKHMLIVMIAFFGVIVSVNLLMAFLASGSWTGLVVSNSYVASQGFNRELALAKAQRESGLRSELSYGRGVLRFELKDANGKAIPVDGLIAEIGRPAYERSDRALKLSSVSGHLYEASANLEPGVWSLRITGSTAEGQYRRDARLFVDAEGNGWFE